MNLEENFKESIQVRKPRIPII